MYMGVCVCVPVSMCMYLFRLLAPECVVRSIFVYFPFFGIIFFYFFLLLPFFFCSFVSLSMIFGYVSLAEAGRAGKLVLVLVCRSTHICNQMNNVNETKCNGREANNKKKNEENVSDF